MRHVVPLSKTLPLPAFYVTQGLFLTLMQIRVERIFRILQLVLPNKVPDRGA